MFLYLGLRRNNHERERRCSQTTNKYSIPHYPFFSQCRPYRTDTIRVETFTLCNNRHRSHRRHRRHIGCCRYRYDRLLSLLPSTMYNYFVIILIISFSIFHRVNCPIRYKCKMTLTSAPDNDWFVCRQCEQMRLYGRRCSIRLSLSLLPIGISII